MSLRLQFDPNQQYQLDAVQSIVDLFDGQPLAAGEFSFSLDAADSSVLISEMGVGNNLRLADEQLLRNLQTVQERNKLEPSQGLAGVLDFSVEMETGTGKTYVYLRTIHELNRQYGFTKFVIVVPSIAIREGVLKNLALTQEHFATLYTRQPAAFAQYSSEQVSRLRSFASSNTLQILVINIDAFAKDQNVINRPNDKLSGRPPIEFVQATRPIVIVDEPQNMGSEARKAAIANLNPLCTLRYSATLLSRRNLAYSLNPVQAYDLGLVKQIEVDAVTEERGLQSAYVRLESVKTGSKSISAKITIDVHTAKGTKRKAVTAKPGSDLYELSGRNEAYQEGYIVNEIDARDGFVELSGNQRIYTGQNTGAAKDDIMQVQLRRMMEEHFSKARKLEPQGIKVLSLIFIDRVTNYRSYDAAGNPIAGKIAKWFESYYIECAAHPENKSVLPYSADEVHNGYFAQDKGRAKDSSENRTSKADEDAFELIMRDKERLLDPQTPLRFIFSHSALREGWDNPNVFQICTLNETLSEPKKRQEIGRGLRLCVDHNGQRVFDRNINRLTVFANQSYESFAKSLQTEIEQETGVKFEGRIKNRAKRKAVRLRKGYELDKNFLELWNRIKHKTRYRVSFSSDALVREAAEAIRQMEPVTTPRILARRAQLQIRESGVEGEYRSERVFTPSTALAEMPDLLGYIQARTHLTRHTILTILRESGRLGDALTNPQAFLDQVVYHILRKLEERMVDGIKYQTVSGEEYDMRLFESKEIESYIDKLLKVAREEKTLTDHIVYDSSVEKQFALDCENDERVKFFIKLPNWFKIPTPIGEYNPDWALIFNNDKRLYFVAETKSTPPDMLDNLRRAEQLKIKCGKAHFNEFMGVEYKVGQSLSEITRSG